MKEKINSIYYPMQRQWKEQFYNKSEATYHNYFQCLNKKKGGEQPLRHSTKIKNSNVCTTVWVIKLLCK